MPKATKNMRLDITAALRSIEEQMPLLDAQWAGAQLYGAPRFSVFDLFGPNELALSRVVGELFDPRGSHGQGTLFLNALLSFIGLPPVSLRDIVHVSREVTTEAGRRIDIIVDTPQVLVGIENKPWAGQQQNQLRDYLNELKRRARGKNFQLILLSDQEAQTAKEQVLQVPYQPVGHGISLHEILYSVFETIKATRTRGFIEDFIRYIDLQFGEGQMTADLDLPYVEAVQAEFAGPAQRKKAIAAVLMARSRIHETILDSIAKFLLQTLQDKVGSDFVLNSKVTLCKALGERYNPWAVRRKTWPANCWLVIESENTRHRGVYFGVRAPDPKSKEVKEVDEGSGCRERPKLDKLIEKIPDGHKTAWFPWWQSCEPSNWNSETAAWGIIESPTGRIEDHSSIQHLASRFVQLAEAVDECLAD